MSLLNVSSQGLVAANMAVNVIAIGLIVLGIVLFVITISFWRGAVEDPEVLAPLEIMQDRKFARADPVVRSSLLNKVRGSRSATVVAEEVFTDVAPAALLREPRREPERPFRDPYPHDDDAVDVVPNVIDPLLNRLQRPRE